MKTILKIYTFLKVFGLLMKRPTKKKLIKIRPQERPQENLIQIGSVEDSLLKATVSVKGSQVYINIDGFMNEFDAMLWAKQQSLLWKRELANYTGEKFRVPTLH
jgi:hypothetical protein